MKKIDIPEAFSQLKQTVGRFPVAVLFCIAYFIVLVFVIGENFESIFEDNIMRFSFALPLGFVLAVGIRLLTEDMKGGWRNLAGILVVPLMVVYFLVTPESESMPIILRNVLYYLVALLFLCIAPVRSTAPALNLWQYNVRIWLRVAFSAFSAGVFFGGFSLALLAIDTLFNVHVDETAFFYLAAFCFSVFAPLFFMSGIPGRDESYDPEKKYPLLRILGQYVLLPILSTYLIILYLYGLKILFTWELPNGWVSSLILIYAGVGIFTYFLLHNNYLNKASKTAVLFGKYFFPSVIPLLLLLFIAILRRICDYGFTEERYLVFAAALWLTGITAYMMITQGRRFRPVIASLAVMALLSAVGPWSAFDVSGRSQRNRLKTILAENNLLENGKWIQCESTIILPDSVYSDIKSIIYYFTSNKTDERYLYPLLGNIPEGLDLLGSWGRRDELMKSLQPENDEDMRYFSFSTLGLSSELLLVSGYDVILGKNYSTWSSQQELSSEDSTAAYALYIDKDLSMGVYKYGQLQRSYDLKSIADSLINSMELEEYNYQTIPREQLTYSDDHAILMITNISGDLNTDSVNYNSIDLMMLWKD